MVAVLAGVEDDGGGGFGGVDGCFAVGDLPVSVSVVPLDLW